MRKKSKEKKRNPRIVKVTLRRKTEVGSKSKGRNWKMSPTEEKFAEDIHNLELAVMHEALSDFEEQVAKVKDRFKVEDDALVMRWLVARRLASHERAGLALAQEITARHMNARRID